VSAFVKHEGMLPDGKTLRDVVTPETYAAWVKATDARHMPRERLDHFRPWLAAMVLGITLASIVRGAPPRMR